MDYCTLGNLECAILWVCGGRFMNMGRPLPLFAVVELGKVILYGWKPRLLSFEETKSAFRGYRNLKGLFACVETSVCGAVRNFGVLFGIGGNFGVVILDVWKLGLLAH